MAEVRVEVVPVAPTGDLASTRAVPPELFANRAEEIADAVREVAQRFRDRLDAEEDTATTASGWTMGPGEAQLSGSSDRGRRGGHCTSLCGGKLHRRADLDP